MARFRSCSRSAACDRSERPSRRGTATWAPAGPQTGGRGVMDAIICLRTATLAIVCQLKSRIWWPRHLPFHTLTSLRFEASRAGLSAVVHWWLLVLVTAQVTGKTVAR